MESRRRNLREFSFQKSQTNASLWLDKYIRDQKEEGQESNAKQDLVNQVSKIEVSTIYENFYRDIWVKSLEKAEMRIIETSGRMIVGLGSESVLETSVTLHRTYGVPFIPGSALKGLAASYAHRFMDDDWKKETTDKITKQKNPIGEAHKLMFGSQDSAGFVIFHDALYVPNSYGKTPLRPDILTVHHQKYYQGDGTAPADWDSPVPIPLLSAQGQYLLAVSANSGDAQFDKKMAELAIEILVLALRDEGIGAKTSSGYGRMFCLDKLVHPNPAIETQQSATSEARTEPKKTAPIEISDLFAEMEKLVSGDKETKKAVKRKLKDITKNLQPGNAEHEDIADALDDKAIELGIKDELIKTKPDWFEPIRIIVGD